MARGFPDWGEYAPQEYFSKSFDIYELSTRLGSPVVYSRTGTVMYATSFNNGLEGWIPLTFGTQVICPSAKSPWLGGYSLLFDDDRSELDLPSITKYFPAVIKSNYGLEVIFQNTSQYTDMNFVLYICTDSTENEFNIEYNVETHEIKLKDSNGDMITVLDVGTGIYHKNRWYFIKFTVDPVNHKYKKLFFNDRTVDISGYACKITNVSYFDRLVVTIYCGGTTSSAIKSYIGSIIITQNE